MSWWRRRKPADDKPPPSGAADEAVSDRRAFFRMGGERLREGGLDALRALTQASAELQGAAQGLDGGPRPRRSSRYGRRGDMGERAARAARPAIRPPGAIDEAAFRDACTGCDLCVQSCPEGAIIKAPSGSAAGEGTPVLRVHITPCALCSDVPCVASCPTAALQTISASEIKIGRAVVFRDLCLNRLDGERCDSCVDQCPIIPSALTIGQDGFPSVDEGLCTGCGVCVIHCPAYPAALHISPV